MRITFDDWYETYNDKVEGFLDSEIRYRHGDTGFKSVKELMEIAWDARYYTLTPQDL